MNNTSRFLIATLLGLLASVVAAGWSRTALAQQDGNVFQTPDRTLLQHLSRARRAIDEQRYSDAVIELGTLLSSADLIAANELGTDPQDYFVGPVGEGGTSTSIKGEAHRLLGSLPPQGRELYELQFGADARALFDAAVRDGDMEKLNEVVRRYFHTQAGYEAMVLLGRLHLDRGQPLAAALCFRRVLDAPAAAAKYDPQLSVLLAACWSYAGMPQAAAKTLTSVQERFPDVELEISTGVRERLPRGDALAWLEQHFGSGPRRGRADVPQWLIHRGNPERNATCAGGMPLANFRWRAPTATDPADEQLIAELQQGYVQEGIPAIAGLQPLAVDDVVLMRTPERLLAVDFKTGKRTWEYPWWNSAYPSVAQGHSSSSRNAELTTRKLQLRQRLWLDSAYGQVSSDGEAVYLLDDLRFTADSRNDPPFLPGRPGFRQPNPNWPKPHNQLVALEMDREGALRWMVGGESGGDEPKLAGAFFLGPPLPLLGQLYAIAEIKREIRLVVLDAHTGRQEWSQQLAHVEDELGIHSSRERRLAGATPSFGNGVLVCPTSAGAVVALDISTRSLLWGYAYPRVSTPQKQFGLPQPYAAQLQNPGQSWVDSTVAIEDGSVILTPVESNHLLCLDLLTGKPKWEPRERKGDLSDMLYVACIREGQAVLVGKQRVLAIRLDNGEPAWQEPVSLRQEEGEMPSGRGFLTGQHYFLPTTSQELVQIDLQAGEIVERTKTGHLLGNLICYRDQIVSQNVDQVAAFYQIEPLRSKVRERLEQSPDDSWALARQGELLLHDGQPQPALESLRRAYQLQPEDEAVRSLLVTTFLSVLRNDFDGQSELAPLIEPLIDDPLARLEYLRLMAAGLDAAGDAAAAAGKYLELSELAMPEVDAYDESASPLVRIDDRLAVRLDRWVQSRLASLLSGADEALQRQVNDAIAVRFEAALDGRESELRRFINYYGFHPLADQARLRLLEILSRGDRTLEADLVLARLEKTLPQPVLATAVAKLAAGLAAAEQFEMSAHYYRRLARQWGHVECLDGKTGGELFDEAAAGKALQPLLAAAQPWPAGRVETDEDLQGRNRGSYRDVEIPIFQQQRGPADNLHALYNGGGGSILLRDGHGHELLRLPLGDARSYYEPRFGINYAHLFGHLMLAVMTDQLVAIDLTRGSRSDESILWRQGLTQALPDISLQRDRARAWNYSNPFDQSNPTVFLICDASNQPVGSAGPLSDAGVVYLKTRTLVCADPLSGRPIWQRELAEAGANLFGDDEYLFVALRAAETATVVSARDGRLLGTRKIPTWDHRWTTRGRYVLAWQHQGNGVRLFLYDAWKEVEVWSELFPVGSRGCLVGTSQVAVLQPDGRLLMRSLDGPQAALETRLEPEANLAGIHVFPSAERYLLVTNRESLPLPAGDREIQGLGGTLPAPMIKGRVYALDRHSAAPLWQTPATIDNYALPLNQPHDVPTLWFMRQVSESLQTTSRKNTTEILCIDRRDGRLLLSQQDIPTRANSYDFLVDRPQRRVSLTVAGYAVTIEFTDQPAPPQPPAQTGAAASADAGENRLSHFAGSVVKALIRGGPRAAAGPLDDQPAEGSP